MIILSLGYLFSEKIICDPLRSPRECLWSLWSQSCTFLCFMLGLVPTSCVEVFVFERGVVYSRCWVVISRWRSLCGRSCVDIVESLLCEGGDVEQWLEPRNISLCFLLILFLLILYSLYLALLILHSYTCLILFVCPHLYLIKRAIEAPQLLIWEIMRSSSIALHGKFRLTLDYTLYFDN